MCIKRIEKSKFEAKKDNEDCPVGKIACGCYCIEGVSPFDECPLTEWGIYEKNGEFPDNLNQ